MKIIRAEHLGMCFGVRDAIALAMKESEKNPLTILGELVHNDTVLGALHEKGIQIESQLAQVETTTVMITAHGASDRTLRQVQSRGHNVVEATCPLVHFAHRSLAGLMRQGYYPIIIGKRDHVEVRGLTGDLDAYAVVLSETDVMNLAEQPRIGVVAQTTQPIDKVRQLVGFIRRRFPQSEVRFIDTVCQPTKQRQTAAVDLAEQSDVVIVIGGTHSNNTRELVATCSRFCSRVHHVPTAADLQAEWLWNAETVGITAGTSTPDEVIHSVEQRIQELAAHRRAERSRCNLAVELTVA